MTVALASAWRPRGELPRFLQLLPELEQAYAGIAITLPPDADAEIVETLQGVPQLLVEATPDWSWGRYLALKNSLELPASHMQYADFDRLLRWVERCPEEWRETLSVIERCDCLVIGRTEVAYLTHPRALLETEAISNLVFSHLLGQPLDLSAGSKGFSRRAVEFLLANSSPGRALGADAEWIVLLDRAGFAIESILVDGLDWESADRYLAQAAGAQDQRQAADAYDADPANWSARVGVAMEIVQSGFEAQHRYLNESTKDTKSTNE